MPLAQLIRLELLVAIAGLALAAKHQGTALTTPWLAEAVILIVLFGAVAVAIFLARVVFGGAVGWMTSWFAIFVAVVIANEALSFRSVILPQGRHYTLTDPTAVSITTQVRGRSEIWATVTNRSRDWLRNAVVQCQLRFDNGDPIERAYSYGVANGYLGEGESTTKPVISSQEVRLRRAHPELTRCRLKYAQFMERPALPVEIAISYDRNHYRHIFTITNRSDQTISNLLLQCRDENGLNRTLQTVGRWSNDPRADQAIVPGGTAELVTMDRSFGTLENCAVLSLSSTS